LEMIEVLGDGPHIPTTKFDYTGVYGKWLFMEEYNAYLGVIDPVAGDVFLYKPLGISFLIPTQIRCLCPSLARSHCYSSGFLRCWRR